MIGAVRRQSGATRHNGFSDMTETAVPGAPRRPDWQAIRLEYENREFVPKVICKRHGITPAQLRYRREREDWDPIRRRPRQTDLVGRLMALLDKQIRELEMEKDMPLEKKARMLAEQVKILDKLIGKGAARRNVEPPSTKNIDDLRAKLVRRLEQSDR
jgi:hypothetical protein